MRGQGEYIAAVVLTMIIILIVSLAINWARYIENIGKIQVVNLIRSKEKLVVIWPYENDRNRILVVNQWDGASKIEGVLIFTKQNQTLFRTIESNNKYLSVGDIKILSLRDLELDIDNPSDIERICLVTIYSNIFCNEFIPVKTIMLQNIEFEVVSSPLEVYVSNTDIVSPMAVTGVIDISGWHITRIFDTDNPHLFDVVSPYLPRVPVALVLSDGFGVYSADAGKKNFTVVVNYNNGNITDVSAYLDGKSYTWSNISIVSSHFLVVDGVPFRILSGYNGTAIYRADIYYAYVSSNRSVARVYSLSYPVKLNPLDARTFQNVIREGWTGNYRVVLGSPVVLANYSLSLDGSLKLQAILAPKSSKFFRNLYRIDALDIDLSGQNIYLARNILSVPVIQAQPPGAGNEVTIYGVWRDIVRNDLGIRSFTPMPLGQGVYGDVIELEYLRIVPVMKYETIVTTTAQVIPTVIDVTFYSYTTITETRTITTRTITDTNPLDDVRLNPYQYRLEVNPLQWIIYDNNNYIAKVITFRFIAPVIPDPDRIAGYILDYVGQMPQTYTALGVMWRDTFTTARTAVCTQNIYTVLPQAPYVIEPSMTKVPWISMFFINGVGLVWFDYESYYHSGGTECDVVLYKYPFTINYLCSPTTITQVTATIAIPIATTIVQPNYEFIFAQIPLSADEPWEAVVVYMIRGPPPANVVLIARKLELRTVGGRPMWVTLTTISTTTYVAPYQFNVIGSMEAGKYQIWDAVAIINGNITRPGSVKNFKNYTATQTIYASNVYTSSIVTQMPTPLHRPYTYLSFQYSDEYLAFVTLIVLAMAFRKTWYKIKI